MFLEHYKDKVYTLPPCSTKSIPFFLRTSPTSNIAKPACIQKTKIAAIPIYNESKPVTIIQLCKSC